MIEKLKIADDEETDRYEFALDKWGEHNWSKNDPIVKNTYDCKIYYIMEMVWTQSLSVSQRTLYLGVIIFSSMIKESL